MEKIKREVIIPEGSAKPLAPYSPGIKLDNLIFTSGQIGLSSRTGKLVSGGVVAEARQALTNLQLILEAAGSSLAQVLKVTVYLKNMEDYGEVNQVYAEFFKENPPARTAIQAVLPAGASVEIDAIALASR